MKIRTETERKVAKAQLAPRHTDYNWRVPVSEWAKVEAEMLLHEAQEKRGGEPLALVPKEVPTKKPREL